ncbi:MFS transporter [Dehalobacter sp. DCM]|uniref:MFS transporter n=1 Tax=Dehalobacter sp. DCM TaxID=2907827 RepID=UPI003081E74C|nr:MFS transporter [Dehalobacter sp. DCM]
MSKPFNRTLLKFAILCVAVQDIGAGAATPALANMIAAFPNVSPETVMMTSSIPSLCLVIFSFVYSKLTEYLNKKQIWYIGAALFLIGGIAPAFLDNIYAILAMRFLLGIAVGFFIPMVTDLVVDFFEEGPERQNMIGWGVAVASAGGIMFTLLGGFLAVGDWHNCFYAYIVSVIFFLVTAIFLPTPEKKKKVANSKVKVKMPAIVYIHSIVFALYNLFLFAIVTNLAIVIVGEQLGNAGSVGVVLTFYTVGSFISSLIYGKLTQVLKGYLYPMAILVTAIGFFINLVPGTLTTLIAGTVVIGIGMGCSNPSAYNFNASRAPLGASTLGISLAVVFMGIGQFIQPWVFAFIMKTLGLADGRPAFLVAGAAIVICSVIMLILNKNKLITE